MIAAVQEEPVYTANKFPRKTWHHLALTLEELDRDHYFDPHSKMLAHRLGKIYVDGVLEATFETRLFDMSSPSIIVGAEYKQYAKQSYFSGLMDEPRLFDRNISAVDAMELAFTDDTAILREKGVVFRADFNKVKGYGQSGDIHDKVSGLRGRGAGAVQAGRTIMSLGCFVLTVPRSPSPGIKRPLDLADILLLRGPR